MDTKYIIIIILISISLIGAGYFTYKYLYKIPDKEYIKINNETTNENFNNNEVINNKPILDYNDINLYPYFEIEIDGINEGKIVFELFDTDVPKTCKNFRFLCSNGLINKNKPSYQDTTFHRVIKDFMIQGGDITNGDGTGGMSIYGDHFNDENFNLKHNQPGLLSMANAGPNTNNSQFFITTKETPWLDNKHVVFGIVINGFDIIQKIENMEINDNSKPLKNILIKKCGLMIPEKN
jgi:cyclophilin family peptidyl-prolyl cis-trans isomerase